MLRKIKNHVHLAEGLLANALFNFPSRKAHIIGVTGTDGKTTTSSLIYHILRTAGKKTAMITTVGAYINDKLQDTGFHVTTPSAIALQKYIRQAVEAGAEYIVVETTSHALDQNRVAGISFEISVLTNITHEHLDYHKTYDHYTGAKSKLFLKSKVSILNRDDESYQHLKPILEGRTELKTYAVHHDADFTLTNCTFTTDLPGDYNKQNCLAAYAVAKLLSIPTETIQSAIHSYKPPTGRMEVTYDKDFKVIIDFAHTPNSFEKVLPELAKMKKNRLIHVFGAAAQRDTSKRPFMGKASSEYADVIILTAEDPRNEPIKHIDLEIRSGIEKDYTLLKPEAYQKQDGLVIFQIDDRAEAIDFAIKIAEPGDIVITTGKGHEQSINYGHGEEPWNEHEVVLHSLKKHNH